MFMNRLFIAQQRKYELVIYYFLEKYYTSAIATEKNDIMSLLIIPHFQNVAQLYYLPKAYPRPTDMVENMSLYLFCTPPWKLYPSRLSEKV